MPWLAGERGDRIRAGAARVPRNGLPGVAVDREEVLRTAALAALAEVAVAEARDEVAGEVRGSLLEDLRAGRVDGSETARRAARLGCDLSRGAVAAGRRGALVAPAPRGGVDLERAPERRRSPSRSGEPRIYAILPARGGDDAPERTAGRGARAGGAAFDRTARPPSRPSARAPASWAGRSPRRS